VFLFAGVREFIWDRLKKREKKRVKGTKVEWELGGIPRRLEKDNPHTYKAKGKRKKKLREPAIFPLFAWKKRTKKSNLEFVASPVVKGNPTGQKAGGPPRGRTKKTRKLHWIFPLAGCVMGEKNSKVLSRGLKRVGPYSRRGWECP